MSAVTRLLQTLSALASAARLPALFLLCCICTACLDKQEDEADLYKAEKAYKVHNTADATMYYERYLRRNPQGDQRWRAWQRLLDLSLHYRHDKPAARSYLEVMLEEFREDGRKRRLVALQLADLSKELHDTARAVAVWELLAEDEELDPETRATVYRHLSTAYLDRLDFTLATQMLDLCIQLPVPASTKAGCLYQLGQTQTLTDNVQEAENSLRQLLAMGEAPQKNRVLATFLLADVLEQQGRPDEALRLFESIRSDYPNPKVVAMRIAYLKGKKRR